MTTQQLLNAIGQQFPISHTTLYKHLNELGIKPVGDTRQCPQRWPRSAPKRVVSHIRGKLQERYGKAVVR